MSFLDKIVGLFRQQPEIIPQIIVKEQPVDKTVLLQACIKATKNVMDARDGKVSCDIIKMRELTKIMFAADSAWRKSK